MNRHFAPKIDKSLPPKQRMGMILNDVITHYSSSNRAVLIKNSCYYCRNDTPYTCAVGRNLDIEHINYILKNNLNDFSICAILIELNNVNLPVPNNLIGIDKDFLIYIQALHDFDVNWDKQGLSSTGQRYVESIKKQFNL